MKTAVPILLFCVSLLHSHAADITVSELANKMPVGQLGKPIGSRIVLTGKSPERPLLLTNPLEVSEVDGKPSATRLAIEMRGEIKIQDGVTYQLEGYESGEFSGPPDWIFNPGSPRPQSPFQYRSFFVVTKVIAPFPKPDAIDRLVAKLSATRGDWVNGKWLPIKLPPTASTEQIVEQFFKNRHVTDYKILQSRSVQIDGEPYTATEVQSERGRKVVLFTAGGAWNREYDAEEAEKKDAPAAPASGTGKPEESPIKSSQLPADDSPQAIAAAAKMGADTAAADIKAGNFRILEYGEAREITKDPQTGFRIQTVAGCKVTKTLLAEADAYNQAMRDWHAKNPPKPKP